MEYNMIWYISSDGCLYRNNLHYSPDGSLCLGISYFNVRYFSIKYLYIRHLQYSPDESTVSSEIVDLKSTNIDILLLKIETRPNTHRVFASFLFFSTFCGVRSH